MQNEFEWKRLAWWLVGLTAVLAVLVLWQWPTHRLKIVMCEVGQGDAFLFVQGNVQILVDGGPANNKVLPCINRHIPFWDRQMELVVVSHAEADHIGGLAAVFSRYRVKVVMASSLFKDDCALHDLLSRQTKSTLKMIWANEGTVVRVGLVSLEALWPLVGAEKKRVVSMGKSISNCIDEYQFHGILAEKNDRSLVAQLQYGVVKMLLTGDISTEIEHRLIERGRLGAVEVLKVAHHGSFSSTSRELLSRINPKYALVSAGKGNSYGHPHITVVDRLEKAGVKLFRTDVDGELVLWSDGKRIW